MEVYYKNTIISTVEFFTFYVKKVYNKGYSLLTVMSTPSLYAPVTPTQKNCYRVGERGTLSHNIL